MTSTDDRVPPRHADPVPRRLAGSAVLTAVLLVIVVVAADRGHTVAGQPTAPRSRQHRTSVTASPRTRTPWEPVSTICPHCGPGRVPVHDSGKWSSSSPTSRSPPRAPLRDRTRAGTSINTWVPLAGTPRRRLVRAIRRGGGGPHRTRRQATRRRPELGGVHRLPAHLHRRRRPHHRPPPPGGLAAPGRQPTFRVLRGRHRHTLAGELPVDAPLRDAGHRGRHTGHPPGITGCGVPAGRDRSTRVIDRPGSPRTHHPSAARATQTQQRRNPHHRTRRHHPRHRVQQLLPGGPRRQRPATHRSATRSRRRSRANELRSPAPWVLRSSRPPITEHGAACKFEVKIGVKNSLSPTGRRRRHAGNSAH